jgi:hypothetical protein
MWSGHESYAGKSGSGGQEDLFGQENRAISTDSMPSQANYHVDTNVEQAPIEEEPVQTVSSSKVPIIVTKEPTFDDDDSDEAEEEDDDEFFS